MRLLKHEMRQGLISLAIWTGSIAFLMVICIILFPEMKGQMEDVSDVFASMGRFTAAFGMDRLSFGTLTGFYAIECGNILGLGGAFYAALTGITALAKEEKEHTAEFLLTHPITRTGIVSAKLASVLLQISVMNALILAISLVSILFIDEEIPWKELLLFHLAYYLLQIEIGGICFGVSAFLRRGGLGIGLGLACLLYFLNLIANISESAEFLKYITPFGYADGADIVTEEALNGPMVAVGMCMAVIGIGAAYWKYNRKDIQ
ncbi:MAG: ABC transporter permease subunit [Firmicutes bacterium]|nr:ABC transporter permease [Bacillota bacterium]MDD7601820.1 ABC transporter permease subunit [Bacillota bacterium]MDY5855833.1 ABC transporter permease subunit [Anaerovoracaceae bacterium]